MKTLAFFSLAIVALGANYDITAVRVLNTTAATSSACNTADVCNGAVIEIDTSSSLATGGTYALGFSQASNNDPATAKIALTVSGTGYTGCSGSTTTVTRTVWGTKQLRQPHPNPTVNDETSSGGTLTLRVFLSDVIYSGETVTAVIGSGVYTSGADSTNAYSGSVTNNSTLAYSVARTIANWSAPGWQRITGSTFTVRAVAFQRHAQRGLPVACVVFTATDESSNTASVSVPYPTVDRWNTFGDRAAVTEYIAAIPTSGLTQGQKITVNFIAYPWVGDSSATMNTGDGVNSQPTPLYAPQTYVLDKTGAYGSVVAVVDPAGSDSNSCAVTEASFNVNSPPPACLTINGAAAKMVTANNSNFSRANAAGTMYLKAGTYNWTGASNSISNTTSNEWLQIMPFPGVSRSSVTIGGQSGNGGFGTRCTSGSTNCGTPVRLKGVTVDVSSAPVQIFNGSTYLWLDGNSLRANGTAPVYQVTITYATNNDFGDTWSVGLGPFSTVNAAWALVRGNGLGAGPSSLHVYTAIGNTNTTSNKVLNITHQGSHTAPASNQPILAFNRWHSLNVATTGTLGFLSTMNTAIGAVIAQNIFESTTTSASLVGMVAHDGSTSTPVPNVMLWHNIFVGGRINRAYNDSGSTLRLRRLWSEIGDIRDQEAIKSDTFPTENAARIGNWQVLYGSGRRSVYNLEAPGFAATATFQMEFGGLFSYNPAITGGQPPSSGTTALTATGYVSRQAYDGTNAGAGDGNYRLTSASGAVRMFRSGQGVLPFDLDGKTRPPIYGSAGAYEQAIILTPAVF